MPDLKDTLTAITQVDNWESINFGILPGENPKGYLFPLGVAPSSPSRQVITYGVAIAISSTSLQGLGETALQLSRTIARSFTTAVVCSSEGVVRLIGNIDIEPPQSYPQQSNVTLTTGFFTAVTFAIEVG